ncbi:MAG: ABC transporter [Gammaproteobacteria bacterium SG8_11]|nr:MAG: ABC transporter [Gammaproteobacteria bacterium SG8_11]
MSSEIAIRVENLSKCYQIYERPQDRLKQPIVSRIHQLIGRPPKNYYREFWALRDISFEVKRGETVGIIGRNGSGKSTLLQMICGTLTPTSGVVETTGRVVALLELGSGFNPEFTGRENVYMNGAVLGLNKEEIDTRFDDIAAFADIGEFIEQPVKMYSSGMLVRLAFAVNVMVEPEIMIVDEALSVGDMNFQAKCMTALTRIQEKGTTILFVSHDIGTVKSLCSRGIFLERGNVISIGPSAEVTEQYVRIMREEMNEDARKLPQISTNYYDATPGNSIQLASNPETVFKTSKEFADRVALFRYGTGGVRATFVELLNLNDEPITFVEFNQKVKVRVFFEAYTEKSISVNVSIFDDKKNNITGCGFRHVDQPYLMTKPGGKYMVEYIFEIPLEEGDYSLRTNISSPIIEDETAEFVDLINDAIVFRVGRWEKARVWSKVHRFSELKVMEL